ncbi:hypothetical protein SAMN05443245_5854 [Paraburkholderia fungorum]|uniref:Uncharacterized protein n=1 Tax=Paraburkholderia fungorum TaxID=134537 RepID=A0A1H1IZ09_9BURK|nr:hypothetical protein [Paraburkholderia fungorum]SDR42518.1 hypothetical protein SAMN05443245_5854 [Paraburkholderia fungorum]
MISLEWMESRACESGQPVGVQIGPHLLAVLWVDGALLWAIDGELISLHEARWILQNHT